MSIKVKFFASLREQFDSSELILDMPSVNMTVSDVWKNISESAQMPENILCAINLDYAKPSDPVKDEDEVAFFPAITGG